MEKIIIYTTPTCFYCKIAKEFFTKHGINFEERDVLKNKQFLKELKEKSHQQAVPMIEIEDQIFVGFDRPVIAKALKITE